MKLTVREKKAIEKFTQALKDKFPDEISKVIIFGSKARGNSRKRSDIDILVIIAQDDWRIGDKIREVGYESDESIDYKFSIQVIPESHIKYLEDHDFQFARNIEKDGVVI